MTHPMDVYTALDKIDTQVDTDAIRKSILEHATALTHLYLFTLKCLRADETVDQNQVDDLEHAIYGIPAYRPNK